MAYAFKLPEIGEGLHEGEIVKLHVGVGDTIEAYAPFLEVQTDKAVVEIPSPVTGKVTELHVKEGEVVEIHALLATLEVEGKEAETASEAPAERSSGTKREPKAEKEKPEQEKAEKETKPWKPQKKAKENSEESPSAPAARKENSSSKRILAMPSVRRLARELQVELQGVSGTGKQGRITAEDVKKAAQPESAAKATASSFRQPTSPQETTVVPLRGMRRAIARRMIESKQAIPHVTLFDDWDAVELVALRHEVKEFTGQKITYLPFFLKAVVSALQAFPYLNASVDMEKEEIVLHGSYHIGVAVATEGGLLVPVLRDVDRKSLLEVAEELRDLVERARAMKLKPEEMQGGTFTITSLGNLGGRFFTPIIAHPEAAILGIGGIRPQPVAREGQVVIRDQLPMSLSFDHRIVDGDTAARFLAHTRDRIEQPKRLILEMR